MANETDAQPFARDLGYLDKFFVNLDAHAGTLPASQGDRLRALIAEEVSRWEEIRGLLSPAAAPVETATGAPAEEIEAPAPKPEKPLLSQRPVAPVPPPPAPAPRPSGAPTNRPEAKPIPGFTVGSLYGQPKK